MNANVRTWADGFGVWHAAVPVSDQSVSVARELIRDELMARHSGPFPLGFFDVEAVEEREIELACGPGKRAVVVYREVWPDEYDLTSSASRQHWIETGRFLRVEEAI